MTDEPEEFDGVEVDAIEITTETARILERLDEFIELCPYPAEDIMMALALEMHTCFEGMSEAVDEGGIVDTAAIVDVTRIVGSSVLLGRKITQKRGN